MAKATKATKAKTPKALESVPSFVLRAAIKAAKDSAESNFDMCTGIAFMMMEANARAIVRKDSIDEKASGKRNRDVFYTVRVKAAYAGIPVYCHTSQDVAEIAGMSSTPASAQKAKEHAARDYIDGKWTLNGKMLPPKVTVETDDNGTPVGKYAGAERKAFVSAFAFARKISFALAEHVLTNHCDKVRELATKLTPDPTGIIAPLSADDVKAFQSWVRDNVAATFDDLRLWAKGDKVATKTALERMQAACDKMEIDDFAAFVAWAQTRLSQRRADAADISASVPDFEAPADDESEEREAA